MPYFLISIFLIMYLILLLKTELLKKYYPLTKKGYHALKNTLTSINYQYNFKLHCFILLLLALGSFFLASLFHLNLILGLIIFIYGIAFFPIIYSKFYLERYYEFEFNNLNLYLQQLILLFKDHPKLLISLKTILPTLNQPLAQACGDAINKLEEQANLKLALHQIERLYPHFIVINLHQLLINVELYGSFNYELGLTILQDDLDDWYDSVYDFKKQQHSLIYKIYLLVVFSLVICGFGIMIFRQLPLSYQSNFYQFSLLSLFLINLTTILFASLPLGKSWINKMELL